MIPLHRALDYEFTVTGHPRLVTVLERSLVHLRVETSPDVAASTIEVSGDVDGEWSIAADGVVLRAVTPGAALARVLEHVNQRAAATLATSVPLHAAAIAHRSRGLDRDVERGGHDGAEDVIALAGTSGSGKSTLCAAAVLRGWGFVADEVTAVVPEERTVRPYHRPIGLRTGGASAIGVPIPNDGDGFFDDVYPWPTPDSRLAEGGVLRGIALVSRTGGPARHETFRPAKALAALVEHIVVPHDERVADVFRQLETIVRDVPVARIEFDTADEGVRLLEDLLERWQP